MPIPFAFNPGLPDHAATILVDPIAVARRKLDVAAEVDLGGRRSLTLGAGVGNPEATAVTPTPDKLRPWSARAGVRQYVLGNFDTGLALGAEAGWAGQGPVQSLQGDPLVGAYAAAKATIALFSLEARAGGEVGGRLGSLRLAPNVGVGVGVSF